MTSADVHKAGRLAATLSTVGPDTVFSYLPGYDGPAVATTLPLGTTVTRPGRSLPPFFTNLLPEGRRLSALQREVKTSGDDELSLLLAVGSDPIGDVQVLPAGEAPSRPEPVVDGDGELDFQTLLAEHGIDPVAIPGAQDKLSAGMITLPAGLGEEGRRSSSSLRPTIRSRWRTRRTSCARRGGCASRSRLPQW